MDRIQRLNALRLFSAFSVLWTAAAAWGAEAPSPGVTPSAPASPARARSASTSSSRNSKGKRSREKEIEGTEARDRFQADTVLKSKYQLNGEQLEVDPD